MVSEQPRILTDSTRMVSYHAWAIPYPLWMSGDAHPCPGPFPISSGSILARGPLPFFFGRSRTIIHRNVSSVRLVGENQNQSLLDNVANAPRQRLTFGTEII